MSAGVHPVTRTWLEKLRDAPAGVLRAHDVPFAVHEDLVSHGWSVVESDFDGVVWESITRAGLKALNDAEEAAYEAEVQRVGAGLCVCGHTALDHGYGDLPQPGRCAASRECSCSLFRPVTLACELGECGVCAPASNSTERVK